MVKLIIRFFYILFFFIELLYFLPKEHLYYLLQEELKAQKIEITQTAIHERPVGISLDNVIISYEGIPVVTLKHLDFTFLILYNNIKAREIKLSSLASSYLPVNISFLEADYSLFHPMEMVYLAKGVFGTAKGNYFLQEKKTLIRLKASDIMKRNYNRSLRYMKREKNGEYSYAKKF